MRSLDVNLDRRPSGTSAGTEVKKDGSRGRLPQAAAAGRSAAAAGKARPPSDPAACILSAGAGYDPSGHRGTAYTASCGPERQEDNLARRH